MLFHAGRAGEALEALLGERMQVVFLGQLVATAGAVHAHGPWPAERLAVVLQPRHDPARAARALGPDDQAPVPKLATERVVGLGFHGANYRACGVTNRR
jgi:hypothetical protein